MLKSAGGCAAYGEMSPLFSIRAHDAHAFDYGKNDCGEKHRTDLIARISPCSMNPKAVVFNFLVWRPVHGLSVGLVKTNRHVCFVMMFYS